MAREEVVFRRGLDMPSASFWILASGFLFTLMSLSSKLCSAELDPFEILFYRSLFGAAALAVLLPVRGVSFRTRHPWAHAKRSLMGIACFLLELCALSRLPLSTAQALDYTSPLFFCFFFVLVELLHRRPVSWPVLGAVLTGFAGVLLVARPSAQILSAAGIGFALASALCGAGVSWFLRDLGRCGEPSLRAVFYFMLAGVLVGGGRMLWMPESVTLPDASLFWPLIGLMTTGLAAQVFSTYAWAHGHPLLNAVFQFSGIFFGVLLGMLYFHESLDGRSWLGVWLIFAAGLSSFLYLQRARPR